MEVRSCFMQKIYKVCKSEYRRLLFGLEVALLNKSKIQLNRLHFKMRVILWSWMLIIISIILHLVIILDRIGSKILFTTSGINSYNILSQYYWPYNMAHIIWIKSYGPFLVWLTRDLHFLVQKPQYGQKVLTQGRNSKFCRRRTPYSC